METGTINNFDDNATREINLWDIMKLMKINLYSAVKFHDHKIAERYTEMLLKIHDLWDELGTTQL